MKERRRRRRRCRNCIRLSYIKQGANVNGSHRYPLLEYLVISRVSLASLDVRAKVEIIEYYSIPFDPITLHSIPFDSLIASVVRHDYRGRR